jgi:opacity protein-like surface antigen
MSQVATAADLPRKAPPPMVAPPPPLWNWTGFYVGGHLGAGWVRNEVSNPSFVSEEHSFFGTNDDGRVSSTGLGVLGGVTIGYNWQMPGQPIVLGIEGDWSFADLKGSSSRSNSVAFDSGFSEFTVINASSNTDFKVRNIATITGRFGLTSGPQDRTLWYVKGGGAYRQATYNASARVNELECFTFIFTPCDEDNFSGQTSQKRNRWGWTVGTGVEFGLWDNWSTKIEYDYLNFGSRELAFNGTFGGDPISFSTTVKDQIHEVKIGLNYRFGWGR